MTRRRMRCDGPRTRAPYVLHLCPCLLAVFLVQLSVCEVARAEKNIILFIGDGMGAAHRQAATRLVRGDGGALAMDRLPVRGLVQTDPVGGGVTDSAAAATAMATGVKTGNRVVGLDPALEVRETILEYAGRRGKAVGLVTTTQVSHATPAAFAAHVDDRDSMTEIARQLAGADLDVLLGGGEDEFLPDNEPGCHTEPGERDDGRNLLEEARARGYRVVCDPDVFGRVDPEEVRRLIGLFADEGMVRPYRPSLADMTRVAIDILSKDEDGFFLMVEGGQIDWASHDNDAAHAIADTVSLDEAVEVGEAFANADNDTLLIVTADHETGGMTLARRPPEGPGGDGPFESYDGTPFYVSWTTARHTGAEVPLTASGPSAGRLRGLHDNTFIFRVMRDALR